MKKYTVVLLRPDYMADPYGQDIYVGFVEGASIKAAIQNAQLEVFQADTRAGDSPDSFHDYALCVMFEGHVNPCHYGWQL